MKHYACFTFTELLACIAGSLFLLGTTVAMIGTASSKDRQTTCFDNLHAVSAAALAYADDHGDYTVPHMSAKQRGWPCVLSAYQPTLKKEDFHCPQDGVKRNFDGDPISYSLNSGHLWNERQTKTNQKEWGPASILSGASILLSRAPAPEETTWFFENHSANNNYRQLWGSNDRSLFSTYTIDAFHDSLKKNNMIFLDGHAEGVEKSLWKRSDNRGIVFKDLHTPETCTPNLK